MSNFVTKEERQEGRELLEATTPAPWWVHYTDDSSHMNSIYISTEPRPSSMGHDGRHGMSPCHPEQADPAKVIAITLLQSPPLAAADPHWRDNAKFIVWARCMMRQLLDTTDELEVELDEAGRERDTYREMLDDAYALIRSLEQDLLAVSECAGSEEDAYHRLEDCEYHAERALKEIEDFTVGEGGPLTKRLQEVRDVLVDAIDAKEIGGRYRAAKKGVAIIDGGEGDTDV